jgi:hypothetical protein
MKYVILVNLIVLINLLPVLIYGQGYDLNIVYTGHMNGELEPCGCSPKTDFGGLARLSGYLIEHGKEFSPYILVDAGNFTQKDSPQGRLKAETALKSFSIIEYDAVALMKNETAFTDDFISPFIKRDKIPALSSVPGYRHAISVKRGVHEINISVDPKGPVKDRLNVLLTDLPTSGLKDIKGWNVIITSSGETLDVPLKIDKTVIISGYPRGMNLGVLSLKISGEGTVSDFGHEWHKLGNDIEEDERVRNILDEYDSRVARLLKEAERPPAGTTYAGISKCTECHQLFEKSWKETRHAGAFSSLENVGKSADPECLLCHTVGFGEEGGFFTIESTPELANVQCEECHGLNREHLTEFSEPLRPVDEGVCLKCHTENNSPDFDYKVYREKIIH